ncbi:META domain-containing protein [Psychroserpens algicola]|uniref:META domain-containing protein n=1 Tax=Psychroserpens algicola TaxID=1719034 RepID=UPI001952CC4F|nr:META domain-containing protein [Psychroserpens algicola]
MKLIMLNLFAILVLLTGCNSKNKQNNTSTDAESKVETSKVPISIENTTWKLVTLMGQDVSHKNAYIIFSKDQKVSGHGGCNNFSGTYSITANSKLSISQVANTLRACEHMDVENTFMSVLEKIDNYSLKDKTLSLNKAKMAPLAVFEAVAK